jgi:hypothetical protein
MAALTPRELDFADTAPVIAEGVGVVDGTPEEVWAVVLDYPTWPNWFAGVKGCRPTSDPATGVGSTREVTVAGGARFGERFIAWDEPHLWAFTGVSGPGLLRSLVERLTITPLGPRLTEVRYRMAFEPKGPAVLGRLAVPGISKRLRIAMRNLNAEVVARRPAPEPEAGPVVEAVPAGEPAPADPAEG